jgi:raffinose/stachyose/melibiose transport system permease protein
MHLTLPASPQYFKNLHAVLTASNGMVITAFFNSTEMTLFSLIVIVAVSSMTGFFIQRRVSRAIPVINFLIMAGLMIPPSVVTTIWVMQGLHVYKTMIGMVFIETAIQFSFSTLLYRAHAVTIPREIDEASIMEGCSSSTLFFRVIFPLMQPVTATIIVLNGVNIFNDFVNPLYFFPGAGNATVQLTLYNFISRYVTQYNLLFADVLLISIPPLILFIIFNRRIVAGIVAGAVKG